MWLFAPQRSGGNKKKKSPPPAVPFPPLHATPHFTLNLRSYLLTVRDISARGYEKKAAIKQRLWLSLLFSSHYAAKDKRSMHVCVVWTNQWRRWRGLTGHIHMHTLCISSERHRAPTIHEFLTPTLDCGSFGSQWRTKWHLIWRSAQHGDGRIITICLLNQPDSKSAVMSITAARLSGQQGLAEDAGYKDQQTRARTKLLFSSSPVDSFMQTRGNRVEICRHADNSSFNSGRTAVGCAFQYTRSEDVGRL